EKRQAVRGRSVARRVAHAVGLAALVVWGFGIETRGRTLEELAG
ncbi:hypothetical protein K3Z80_24655, partial [Pseudomonas aeruginosa]|nr:hypothetical protein [Pseudomonas aeruginosa]